MKRGKGGVRILRNSAYSHKRNYFASRGGIRL